MAGHSGVSKSTVQRWFKLFGVQPHRQGSFKLSTDPFFVEKVRDIVGLYLNPPDHAVVLCVDEKSQIQALQRTQPVLPMGLAARGKSRHPGIDLTGPMFYTGAHGDGLDARRRVAAIDVGSDDGSASERGASVL